MGSSTFALMVLLYFLLRSIQQWRTMFFQWAGQLPKPPPKSSAQTASRSFQPFLPGSLSDRPTDHTSRSVTIVKKPNSVIVYGYNKYFWSSRLDRSDQLQQSAAIFRCKYRRIAVYPETHCNVTHARRERFPPAYSTGDTINCWLIYWRTTCLVPAFDDT